MADSKRQRIIDAVKARMQTVLIANGYATDIGQKVFDWRVDFQGEEADADLPCISVCDMVAEAAPRNGPDPQSTTWLMPIQLRVYAKRGDTPSVMRSYLKDLQRAVRQDDRWKSASVGLAMNTYPLREGPLIPDDSFEIVGGILEIELQVYNKKFDAEV